MDEKLRKIVSITSSCFILLFLLAFLNRTGSLLLFWKEEPSGSITHDSGFGHYAFVRDENLSKLNLPFFLKEDDTYLEPDPLSVNEDITAVIKEYGGGRYQLLPNNDLYLSATDGNPEDHEYSIISPAIIRNRYLLALLVPAALTAAAALFLCVKHKDAGILKTTLRTVTAAFFLMLLIPWNRMIFPGGPLRVGQILFLPILQRNAFFIILFFLTLLASCRFSERSKTLLILSILVTAVSTFWYFVPEWDWFGRRADSAAYLQPYSASSIRTPGYPLFIESVYKLSGNAGLEELRSETEPVRDESLLNGRQTESRGLLSVVRSQKLVLAAAFLILFGVYCRYYDPAWFAFAAQIILCGGFLGTDNSYIMSECLSQAALLAACAALIVTVKKKDPFSYLTLCVLSGIGILIRPANLFLAVPILISFVLLIREKRKLPLPLTGILVFLAISAIPAVNISRHYGIFVWMPTSGYAEIGRAVEIMQPDDPEAFEDPELRDFCSVLLSEKQQAPDTDQNTYVWNIAVPAAESRGYDRITCSPLFNKISRQIFTMHFSEFTASLAGTVRTALERTRLQAGPVPFIAILLLFTLLFALRIREDSLLGMGFVLMHAAHLCISMVNQPERRYIYSTEILCLLGWLLIWINLINRPERDRE